MHYQLLIKDIFYRVQDFLNADEMECLDLLKPPKSKVKFHFLIKHLNSKIMNTINIQISYD